MQITIDENKYCIDKRKTHDTINIKATLRYRHCKCCKKKIEAKESDMIGWYDSDRLWRTGYFCREHKLLICKVLKKIDRI